MEVSLRERKKVATRQALYEAVLGLAVDRGFDCVTVEAIADQANVCRRTFSNYFANKEEALLHGDQIRIGRLLHELRDRPAGERPWQALCASAAVAFADLDQLDPKWLIQLRLVRRHPSLLAQQVAAHSALELELATEIARRAPTADPLLARIQASTFLAALRTTIIVWSEQPESGSVLDVMTRGLELVGDAVRLSPVGPAADAVRSGVLGLSPR